MEEQQEIKTETVNESKVVKKDWYKKWWGIVLAILFLPYFGIWYTWAKAKWNKNIKIAATAGFVLWIILGFVLMYQTPQTTPNTASPKANTSNESNKSTKDSTKSEEVTETKKPAVPAEYNSALNQATTYANTMHMSKQGVYDQLVSQYGGKFTAAAAKYAVDNVVADWNANALATAKTYQSEMSLSPAAIHDQLTSAAGEKFTQAQADYAIAHLND